MSDHDGHRKRVKEQFLAHGEDFHDHQLLELLLYYAIPKGDVNPLAHQLLQQFGSLSGVLDALPESLVQVPGVGDHTASLLKLIPTLSARYHHSRASLGTVVTTAEDAFAFLAPLFRAQGRNEVIYLLCMDGRSKVLGVRKLNEGTANTADLSPRKVVEVALALNATQVILAHSHTSGIALPSQSDLLTTRQLWTILRDVGVTLVDHLIFTADDMLSFKDSGFLKAYTM